MIISQSFKVKQPDVDGKVSFSEDTYFSTTDNLVFYKEENNKSLRDKTKDIEQSIADEGAYRETAISNLRIELQTKINNDVSAAKEKLDTKIDTNTTYITANTTAINNINTAIDKINNLESGILFQAKGYADEKKLEAVNEAKKYTDDEVAEITDKIKNNTTRLDTVENDLQSASEDIGILDDTVANLSAGLDALKSIVGELEPETELVATVLQRLDSIEAELTVIKDRLTVLETPTEEEPPVEEETPEEPTV